jgi:translation elongation factor EF-Ts
MSIPRAIASSRTKSPQHKLTNKSECIFADILEREKAIFVEQAKESGKPDTIISE